MSEVEEAASLFGAIDTANDPFAATLAESPEPSDVHSGSELFSGQNYEPAADLFGTNTSSEAAPYGAPASVTHDTPEYANTHNWNTTEYSSYDYSTASGATGTGYSHVQQTYSAAEETQPTYSSYEPTQVNHLSKVVASYYLVPQLTSHSQWLSIQLSPIQ